MSDGATVPAPGPLKASAKSNPNAVAGAEIRAVAIARTYLIERHT